MTVVMNAPAELPACPFCGKGDLAVVLYYDMTAAVFCSTCHAVGPRAIDKVDGPQRVQLACERWNTRSPIGYSR